MTIRTTQTVARADRGTAVLEFLVISVLLTVPLVYTLAAIARIHETTVLAESVASTVALGIARNTVRPGDAQRVGQLTGAGRGLSAPLEVTVRCGRADCDDPGGDVTVTVTTTVALPMLDAAGPQVRAQHVEVVDRFIGVR